MAISIEDLEPLRDYLYRFALFQLQQSSSAEDAVQETFLAALEKPDSFTGGSSLKTWLTGILKFKIIDTQRRLYRDPQLIAPITDEADNSDFDSLFNQTGHWGSDAPRRWEKPEACLEDRQFWQVYSQCSRLMPRRTAMVFAMREELGLEIEQICQQLEITATNCSAMLYRARMSLRLCLEKNWFGAAS